jgi:spermidine/putrescine-binding protein
MRDWIARTHDIDVTVEVVASPAEARTRAERATLAGPQGSPGRGGPADLVCLGLEDCADWRAAGLLLPLDVSPPDRLRKPLSDGGALDQDGRAWLAPMTLGFDVVFATPPYAEGAAAALALAAPPPSWEHLLDPAFKDRVLMEPDAAVWIALRSVDPGGDRLRAAAEDSDSARDLFKEARQALKPWRAALKDVWTDTATFLSAIHAAATAGEGLVGSAWDGLIRRLLRHGMAPPPLARVPLDGAVAWLDGLAVPAGAAQPDAARRLAGLLSRPGEQAVWAAASDAIPAHPESWTWMQTAERNWVTRVLSPDHDDGLSRLWFRPSLSGLAAKGFAEARDRFEYA